jgi:hypothetical protein
MPTKGKLATELRTLLEETFETHHGMFTNRGTSLFETLEQVSAQEASLSHGKEAETVAGHVFHMSFYLTVAMGFLRKTHEGDTDWDKSWVVKGVDAEAWERLKGDLRGKYHDVMAFLDAVDDWDDGDTLGGLLGILAHNAFHLGAIRELLSA